MRSFSLNATVLLLLLPVFIGLIQSPLYAAYFSKPVKEIRIEDSDRANQNTIRFYIKSKIGEPYSIKETREDIRRIYSLGYFDNIKLEVVEESDGLILIYRVVEKPFLKSFKVTGYKNVQKNSITDVIQLKKGTFFQKHIIKKDINAIKAVYQKKGFYFTHIEPVIKEAPNNQVEVEYKISENQKIKIARIEFNGNSFFKGYELEKIIETKKTGLLSFITDVGNYEREILKTDVLRLESYYRDFGFIKAVVEEPMIEMDRESGLIIVTFDVTEGDQYFIREISAEGDQIHTADEILEKIMLEKGKPFNQSAFRTNIFGINEMYSQNGYAYATVIPNVSDDPKTKTVDIHIRVDPGSKIYIGMIRVSGNDKTKENVIRREFRLHEGEIFNSEKLRRTRERLVNTGFFETVEINQKSGTSPELMDLEVEVAEKPTGNFSAGMGYSSFEKLFVAVEISEKNVFGTGRELSLGLEYSKIRSNYRVKFTEPRFMDRDILLGFEIFNNNYTYNNYDSSSQGFGVSLGRGIGEYWHFGLNYRLEDIGISINMSDEINEDIELFARSNVSSYLLGQVGDRITSTLSPSATVDTRDNRFDPTKGYRLMLTTPFTGGPIGGDLDFYKIIFDARRHISLPLKLVFTAHGKIGYAKAYGRQSEVPIFEHFYIGGVSSLRGFSRIEVGPLDENGESIGGGGLLLFNFEVGYKFGKVVKGIVFYDRGQVYGTEGDLAKTTEKYYDLEKMRHSVGFGFRMTTPVAPFILVWGFKLDKQKGESPMEFHFSMGYDF